MFSRNRLTYEAIPLPDRRELNNEDMAKAVKEFYELMRKRHTIREFSHRGVSQEVIEDCIRIAGTAPSGANHQPWHFVAISKPEIKARIRKAAETEEQAFYAGNGHDDWLKALEPLGTDANKPHLQIAPWLIVVFAQRYGIFDDGERFKNYYVNESVGIASGFLLTALHHAGLSCLTHTPNPMKFLNQLLNRPKSEKPVMIIATGHPDSGATVPAAAKIKKPLQEILTVL